MEGLFAAVNAVLSFVTPVSDFFWDFPKMFGFWKAIPLLGQFSLAIIVLVGSGLYFTFRLGFIQIQCFSRGVRTLMDNHSIRTGISPLAAFCLSTAMRVGPGNIIGVTGAIAAGGPGALFWMWMAAFFGMATKYAEGLLAVKYRETDEKGEIAGGPMYYIKNGMGKYPGTDIQGEAGKRICGRPSILCAASLREQSVDRRGTIAGLYRVCHDVPACTGL